MRRKIPRYHSYSLPKATHLIGGKNLPCFNAAIRIRLLTKKMGWAYQLGSDDTKKYRLRASTKCTLSVSFPFSEFFVTVFTDIL